MTAESNARAVKDALRTLVDGGGERAGGGETARVSAAADALSTVERAAAVADAGGFERVRAAERAATRRGDDALADQCREVLDVVDAYRRAASAAGLDARGGGGTAGDADTANVGGVDAGGTATAAGSGGSIDADTADAGLMSGDAVPTRHE
ncbi:hypothetical protein [Candidatus Halobonum tyrrellensis]|uniref:Uncharacterized protein n=1 Tax=Candidatus Halobonum tyrrellensis G22 TaxID=1324957 RepID=V4HCI4_9EURY|nr:hypothetical protein [Candidatus Halobonum tyrrellensis]ESP88395.1 hypothetical protein K933_09737 [Candidatus Halobonum tyrrellensis G22]